MASSILSFHNNLRNQHLPICSYPRRLASLSIPCSTKFPFYPHQTPYSSRKRPLFSLHSSNSSEEAELHNLPDKKKPLYSHSLPSIESWLKSLHFYQSKDDRSLWFVQHPNWHAQLSLDVTDLCIRYLKSGPGTLEKDVERRFKYALSREDIEKAILGGP